MGAYQQSVRRMQTWLWGGALAIVFLTAILVRPAGATSTPTDITVSGFSTPESVFHDVLTDTYLVSNINGAPLDKDDNGFISRVSPSGQILDLKWIDGTTPDVTLHAPKGMGVVDNKLYVTDIDTMRVFNRFTGQPLGSIPVPGSTFLNDVKTTGTGVLANVYFTDSGLDSSFNPTGTDTVYKMQFGQVTPLATGADLASPNGLETSLTKVYVATFNSNKIFAVNKWTGTKETYAQTPQGGLDGLVRLWNGTMYVSSWGAGAVYKITPNGAVSTEMTDVPAPADIGHDALRQRLMVPLFNDNMIRIRSIQ